MGSWWSYITWGGDPDSPDSLSGLSKRDVYLVQKSWNTLHSNKFDNGSLVFIGLFHENETTRGLFDILKNVPEEQYKSSYLFMAHVLNFMSTLNLAIENLDKPKLVMVMMHDVGLSHKRLMIKPEYFENLKTVLLKVLRNDMKQDARSIEAWSKTIDFAYKTILPCLETN